MTLLRVLLCERGHPVSDVTIMEALWPAGPAGRALDSLRVHDLRRALEPGNSAGSRSQFVVRQSESYYIPRDAPLWTDFEEFGGAARAAKKAAAAGRFDEAELRGGQALNLYEGDLFAESESSQWFNPYRERLRSEWLDVLTLHATLRFNAGDVGAALHDCLRVATEEPAREEAHRFVILLLARRDGQAAASQYFLEMFKDFRRRFGLAPSRRTAALMDRITSGEALDALDREFWPLYVVR